MKRILIFGAEGQLGRELCKMNPAAIPIAHTSGDVRVDAENFEQLVKVFHSSTPDIVINASAMTNVDGCETNREGAYAANALAVKNITTLCRKYSCILYHISTDYVFDGVAGNYNEVSIPNPINYYGFSKAIGDAYATSYDKSVIIRTSGVYGRSNNFPRFVFNSLVDNKNVNVLRGFYSPIHSRALAGAITYLIDRDVDQYGILNIAGERVSRTQLANRIAKRFGFDSALINEVDSIPGMVAKRPFDSSLNVDMAKNLIKTDFYSSEKNLEYFESSLKEKENNSR